MSPRRRPSAPEAPPEPDEPPVETLAGFTAAVLTVSTSKFRGEGKDLSGEEAATLLAAAGAGLIAQEVVPDDRERIAEILHAWCDDLGVDLIVTTGGTGVAREDVTPEATELTCERMVPGLAELMRVASLKKTPHAALARGVAGTRGHTLIFNLPGSPGGVLDCLQAVLPVLPHAVRLLHGKPTAHHQTL